MSALPPHSRPLTRPHFTQIGEVGKSLAERETLRRTPITRNTDGNGFSNSNSNGNTNSNGNSNSNSNSNGNGNGNGSGARPSREVMYEAGIFFDNASHHTDEMAEHSKITSVNVGETSSDHFLPIDSKEYRKFIAEVGLERTTCDIVASVISTTTSYDKKSGLKESHLEHFYRWALDNADKKCVALFDWDRTLTVFEGLDLPPDDYFDAGEVTEIELNKAYRRVLPHFARHPLYITAMRAVEKNPITFANLVEFYCGGARRLELIRSFFGLCKSMEIDVIILTNNVGCNRPLYHKIVDALVNHTTEYELVCSAFPPYDAQKIRFVYMDPRFVMLRKSSSGGMTKRKTRKHRKTLKKAKHTRR